MDDKALLSKDKIAVDIAKLERNLNQEVILVNPIINIVKINITCPKYFIKKSYF